MQLNTDNTENTTMQQLDHSLTLIDDHELSSIRGGGIGGLVVKGYKTARPYLAEAASFVKDTAIVAGGAVAAWTGIDRLWSSGSNTSWGGPR